MDSNVGEEGRERGRETQSFEVTILEISSTLGRCT